MSEKTVAIKSRNSGMMRDALVRLFRNKAAILGLIIIVVLILSAIFADIVSPFSYDEQDLRQRFLAPSAEHFFGTDEYGRDIFSRIIYGSRTSLLVGAISVTISSGIGTILGAISGYYGNRVDNIIMRLIDVMLAIPNILLAISIAATLGPGIVNVMIAVGISSVPGYARLVRASVMSLRDQEFIEAARSIGANDARIILRHILPNCMAPIIVQATMSIAIAILSAAALSFLGLGVQPPMAEWGSMLSNGRAYIRDYWWVVTFPGVAIMSTVFAFNLFGDGLRDALDPRLKQ
ncbi:MAG: peptide/nickel transport system permease protein [Clostridiales bacterium]|jgi:peptide/nickel transport system permease protein|nr:peptide/nickel transport system permease protein [Clostridiales bacterium]MDN5298992.1 peptide/nickel transport system permease protein [Clostridiales bacterium]